MQEKKYYEDINYIRIIMILSVIMLHSFTPFAGGWPTPEGYPRLHAYAEIARYNSTFNMEIFVFISGFLFGYKAFRIRHDGKPFALKPIIWSKIKRIMIPCVLFSLAYALMFPDKVQPLSHLLYRVVSGAGHMWFLPMLFTCIVIVAVAEKLRVNGWIILLFSFVLSLFPHKEMFFQLGRTSYFLFFFYLGYALRRYDIKFVDKMFKLKWVVLSLAMYLFLFDYCNRHWFGTILKQQITYNQNLTEFKLQNLVHVGYAFFAVLFIYLLINYLLKKNILKPSRTAGRLGVYCFGIYLFQQFILKYLYYDTPLHNLVSPYIFPWIGFFTTSAVSFILTYLSMKTRIGKMIMVG